MFTYNPTQDLWGMLRETKKHIVMYGMGNGADKILAICEERGITVSDFFASDGFVRGHSFHGKTVLSYADVCEKYGKENLIVLLSFATSLSAVMERILQIAAECELYIPDVPVFGSTLFDLAFFRAHREEMAQVYEMLADAHSKQLYENVIRFRLTGRVEYLTEYVSTTDEIYEPLLGASAVRSMVDLGAYNGDTVREMARYAPQLGRVYAMEPDRRNFRKLKEFSESGLPYDLQICQAAAWSEDTVLRFDASGNRNANVREGGKTVEVEARRVDGVLDGVAVDYIKYDVEGAEREALIGSQDTILRHHPKLLISLYHRSEDIYALPLQLVQMAPNYRLYLRRYAGFPAWDLNLYGI